MSSETAKVGLTFSEFSQQLVYNKTYLIMLVLPLFLFANFIQNKLDLFSTQIYDKTDSEDIKIDMARLSTPATSPAEFNMDSMPENTPSGDVKTLLGQFIMVHHPYLKMILEYKELSKEFVYYWGMLLIGIGVLSSVMYVIDSFI